jgi:hypothetical protein
MNFKEPEAVYLENPEDILKKVIEERKEDERKFHRERVARLMREKLELEIRLAVVNDLLKHIEEWALKTIDERS